MESLNNLLQAVFQVPPKLQPWNTTKGQCKFPSQHHRRPLWPIHDLVTSWFLVWLLPTHTLTHLIKFLAVLILLVGTLLGLILHEEYSTQQQQQQQDDESSMFSSHFYMYWTRILLVTSAIAYWVYWYYHTTLYAIGKPWMDPSIPAINRVEMHVPLRLFEDTSKARRAACLPQLVAHKMKSMQEETDNDQKEMIDYTTNVILLDSKDAWQFQLLNSVEEGLSLVYNDQNEHEPGSSNEEIANMLNQQEKWSPITVPGHWMLQGFDDFPIYTNKKYPFPCIPPVVPRNNPTGVYKRTLELSADWITSMAEYVDGDEWSIMLHGIESACFVFWDGNMLGFCKDSRLPSEFIITKEALQPLLLQPTTHRPVIHLVMARWSDGSYMEDQDHWWMAGLHRSVELIRRSARADILDYHVKADASGDLTVSVHMRKVRGKNTSLPRIVTARLYADEQLSPDGDLWKPAEGALWNQTQTIVDSQSSVTAIFQTRIASVLQWTAETPNLYTLVLEQSDPTTGRIHQVESCRVGFRTIDIKNGVLCVNGKRITICGINRHEHDPDYGKVVSLNRMKQDIVVLKQNNFNAIRTSHYPTHSSFYRLCDYFGMYVCDEANIETDGMKPMGRLANDWGWENSFVTRAQRMVQRDWNHPSIIMWSLGNESGRGCNLQRARKRVLELDTSRPICYEGGGSWAEGEGTTELTDIACPMYPSVTRTMHLAKDTDDDRPLILCEYSHSMNNSNGNLSLYWDVFWDPKYPRSQGGFIWDFVDQGLRKRCKDGREYFGYGGDFGDKINDRQFCINGMFSPDREPHPCVAEIKYLQQPVEITPAHSTFALEVPRGRTVVTGNHNSHVPLCFVMVSRYSFLSLSHLRWKWQVVFELHPDVCFEGETTLQNGMLWIDPQPAFEMLQERKALSSTRQNAYICIEGLLLSNTSWANADHMVVSKQFLIPFEITGMMLADTAQPQREPRGDTLSVKESPKNVTVAVTTSQPFLIVDKASGWMKSHNWEGRDFLWGHGMRPNLTRAATDNDRGGLELVLDFLVLSWAQPIVWLMAKEHFSYEAHWKLHGISQSNPPLCSCSGSIISESDEATVVIETKSSMYSSSGRPIYFNTVNHTPFDDGRVLVRISGIPSIWMREIRSLPRIGFTLELNPAYFNITYFGLGPHENYIDRQASARMGLWKTTPKQMGFDYIVPSENGNRCDCTWVSFESDEGGIVLLAAEKGKMFNFSALLHSQEEIHNADHTFSLDPRHDGKHPIYVNVDYRQMGLGGDVSWFPCVYPEFHVKGDDYNYSIWFLPIRSGENAVDVVARANSRNSL